MLQAADGDACAAGDGSCRGVLSCMLHAAGGDTGVTATLSAASGVCKAPCIAGDWTSATPCVEAARAARLGLDWSLSLSDSSSTQRGDGCTRCGNIRGAESQSGQLGSSDSSSPAEAAE